MNMFTVSFCNQQAGGLQPLLALLNENNGNLQHNAAFALYGLADNEDNIPVREDKGLPHLECSVFASMHRGVCRRCSGSIILAYIWNCTVAG